MTGLEAANVKRMVGPTVPRWQLGEILRMLRETRELDRETAARHLGCSVSKIQNIETGESRVNKKELESLLDELYQVDDDNQRAWYLELQQLGNQRGWWSKFGRLPAPFAEFLGIESAATRIEIFMITVIAGLIQTEQYARALERTVTPSQTNEQIDKQVQLRLERQKQVLDVEDRPSVWVALDESVLLRQIGGRKVLKDQLAHIERLSVDKIIELQVVPLAAGGHPGTLGSLEIYSFDEDLHSPIAYVESQAGNLYMEKPEEVQRCVDAYTYIRSTALSPGESLALLRERAQSL